MGLLSSPSNKQLPPILLKIAAKQSLVSTVCFLAGIVWLSLLAYRPYNSGCYFSENALLPGLVQTSFKEDSSTRQYFNNLKGEAERYPSGMPHAFISAQFKQLGLDVYTHNFSLNYPLGDNKVFKGKNVYAILRAPHSASTEAIVISAPYRAPDSIFTATNAGIAMMMSLAALARRSSYWARDIVFLVTEHEQLGMEAWLEAYHHVSAGSNFLNSGQLEARAGAIQAAINLEIPAERNSHFDVRIEGLNGQLPNLDLVNLAHRLFQQEKFATSVKEREDAMDPYSLEGFVHSALTLLSFMTSQATGVPSGNHGLFHRFGIEALTVTGYRKPGSHTLGFVALGKALEGIVRSLNNLQERFHQSFFFYLMPATNRYISIGVYMPPFGLLISAVLLQALTLYIQRNEDKARNWGIVGVLPLIFAAGLSGVVFSSAPRHIANLNRLLELNWSTENVIFAGYVGLGLVHLVLFAVLGYQWLEKQNVSARCVHCITLLLLAAVTFAVAMGNVSLAALVSLLTVPVFSVSLPAKRRISNFFKRLIFLLIHPLVLLFLVSVIDTCRVFPEEMKTPLKILGRSFVACQRALVYSIVDSHIYGNWLFPIATCLYLPLWSISWANLSNSV